MDIEVVGIAADFIRERAAGDVIVFREDIIADNASAFADSEGVCRLHEIGVFEGRREFCASVAEGCGDFAASNQALRDRVGIFRFARD